MKVWHFESRFVVDQSAVDMVRGMCSVSGRTVWVTKSERLTIHTLKGVPGKHVDVLLPDHTPEGILVCEIGRKTGCYDHAKRWRITFRSWGNVCHDGKEPNHQYPGPGTIRIDECPDGMEVIARWQGGMWGQLFPQLHYKVAPGDVVGVFLHQWKNWFSFLPFDDVKQAAMMWAELPHTKQTDDICVLNRTASCCLYDLARNMGWRKLTIREKRRLGLPDDARPWQRQERILSLANSCFGERNGTTTGCGEYTHRASSGKVAIRTAYGIVEED